MPFEDISNLELWLPFCSTERNHFSIFGRRYQEEQFCKIILNLDKWFRRRWCLKISLIWSSRGLLFSGAESLCNIGRGYYEEQFCEIILNLDQWFRRRCLLKIFPIWSFGGHFVQRSENMFAIFW